VFRATDTARREEWAAERPIVQAQDTVSIRKPTNRGVAEGERHVGRPGKEIVAGTRAKTRAGGD